MNKSQEVHRASNRGADDQVLDPQFGKDPEAHSQPRAVQRTDRRRPRTTAGCAGREPHGSADSSGTHHIGRQHAGHDQAGTPWQRSGITWIVAPHRPGHGPEREHAQKLLQLPAGGTSNSGSSRPAPNTPKIIVPGANSVRLFEIVRRDDVIVVDEHEQLSGRSAMPRRRAAVSPGSSSRTCLDPGMPRKVPEGCEPLARGVVHHDQFPLARGSVCVRRDSSVRRK